MRSCRCGPAHHSDDSAIGTALDPDSYDYQGAILWQAHSTALWNRFTTALTRALATQLGIAGRRFTDHARLSYAKVAEYQRRGLVHFHAAIRLDGPAGPADPPPAGLDAAALHAAIRHAANTAALTVTRPDGTPLLLGWGAQLDLRSITATAAEQIENSDGEITDGALAGYIAKYATKTAYLDVTEHHRRMIETAWWLGNLSQYAHLGLRRWAHMLGFRGHFLTKSRRFSLTFADLRQLRRTWRLVEDLTQLGHDTDPDSVVLINNWRMVGIGHRNEAERELAHAVAERRRLHLNQSATARRAT